MKNCPKCNANLPDDSDFCTNCGSKISEIQNNSAGKKKGSKTIKVLLIIIAVLLAIGIAVGAYFIFKDNNSSADQNNNIVSEEDDKDSDDEDKNNDKDPDIEIEPDEDVDVDVDITKDGELVIGVSGPLTGLASMYGNSVLNGACLAVDEINAAGGINGIKLELISADDEADSGEKAVSAYNSLKDQGMQIFLGTVTSGSCLAVIEKTKADNMFQLTPSASADGVIKNDNCFQICFTDSNQGKGSAEYIAGNKLATKVGVIYDSSDAYSSGILYQFKKAAADKGLEIVAEQAFTKDCNKDFSAQVKACKDAGADLVFLPIYYTEAALILQQADSYDYHPKFFGCDCLEGILSVENFDARLAEGVMLLTPFAADADDKATQDFVAAYKAKYNNEIPNQFAADAYDGVYIIAELLKANNVTADMSASAICDILKAKICEDGFKYPGVTGAGADLTWDESGAVSKKPMAVIIRNGKYVAVN